MKIAILDDYQDAVRGLDCFALLKGYDVQVLNQTYKDTSELAEKLKDAEALILIRERTKINDDLLSKLPKLKYISQTGKISSHIDLSACNKYGVVVAEGVGAPVAPSELCWALILSSSRHIPAYVSELKNGFWQSSGSLGIGRNLKDLTIGIWGYGKIGKRVAQYAKAFEMNVLVWGSEYSRNLALSEGFFAAKNKNEFFESADILSLHLRLNQNTRHVVKFEDLSKMKPNSLLVNISRSELIETNALYKALKLGRPGFAALDVYDIEPINIDNEPLLKLSNVICSPHLGYVEKSSYELYFRVAFENFISFISNKPQNIVNKELLKS